MGNPSCGGPSGHLDAYTVMGNVIYDFLPSSRVNPFIGVGVGVIRADTSAFGQFSAVPAGQPAIQTLSIRNDQTNFAYQGLAGSELSGDGSPLG